MGTRQGDFICGKKGKVVHPGCFGCDIVCWDESRDHLPGRRPVREAQNCGDVKPATLSPL